MILVGITSFYFAIIRINTIAESTKDYIETTGTLLGYKSVKTDIREGANLYYLVYSYTVGEGNYTAVTDYSTEVLPQKGSTKKIKYNPDNPAQAVIDNGSGVTILLILLGVLFTAIPITILVIKNKKVSDFIKTILISIVCELIGLLTYVSIGGINFNVIEVIKIDPIITVFSLTMMAVGLYIIVITIIQAVLPRTPK